MPKIITVTANTAIDFVIELNGLATQNNIQAISSHDFACGKGINVARAVASLGVSVTCLGFVGAQSQSRFQALQTDLLKLNLTAVAGSTRTNLTLYDQADQQERHIRTTGYSVSAEDCKKLIKTLHTNVDVQDIVIFSGSLPAGVPVDWYSELIGVTQAKGGIPYLDSSGPFLAGGVPAKPYLIKPNLQELEELTGSALPTEELIVKAALLLVQQGVRWVIISLGAQGVLAVSEQNIFRGKIDRALQKIVTTIGCGDALLGGLAVAQISGLAMDACIKQAVGCGTANALNLEPGQLIHQNVLSACEHTIVTKYKV